MNFDGNNKENNFKIKSNKIDKNIKNFKNSKERKKGNGKINKSFWKEQDKNRKDKKINFSL